MTDRSDDDSKARGLSKGKRKPRGIKKRRGTSLSPAKSTAPPDALIEKDVSAGEESGPNELSLEAAHTPTRATPDKPAAEPR